MIAASGVRRKSSFSDLVALAMMTSPGALSSMSGLPCRDIVWRIFLAVVNPEARRIALKAFHPQCLVHGLDDFAALPQLAQGRLQFFAQLPAARRGLAGKPHSLQLAKPRQPQRAVGDAARIGRRVPTVYASYGSASHPTKISKTTPCKVAWWSLAWML